MNLVRRIDPLIVSMFRVRLVPSPLTRILAPLIVFLGIGLFYICRFDFMLHLTNENQLVQNLSAVFWFCCLLQSLFLWTRGVFDKRLVFGLVALSVLCMGEETSWGQHYFGFEGPEVVRQNNVQGETNLHNLSFLYREKTWRNSFSEGGISIYHFVSPQNLFRIFFLTFFLLLPALVKVKYFQWITSLGYRSPPFFLVAAAGILIPLSFVMALGVESEISRRMTECREMVYAVFFMIYVYGLCRQSVLEDERLSA